MREVQPIQEDCSKPNIIDLGRALDKAPVPNVAKPLKTAADDEYFRTNRKRYDFDENGIDYPKSYKEEYGSPDINTLRTPSDTDSYSEASDAGASGTTAGTASDKESDKSGSSTTDTSYSEQFVGTFREDNPPLA